MNNNYETEIHIHGPMSILQGKFPRSEVRAITSYPVDGAQFSRAYRKGIWDGRKHLLNLRTGAFPTGLVSVVHEACEDMGYTVKVTDHRIAPSPAKRSFKLKGVKMEGKYDYQLDACKAMVTAKQGIVKIATNGGKTEIACGVTKYLKLKTLFIVSTVELLHQARERFQTRLGVGDAEVGIVGAGTWAPGSLVTIAMLPTLESRIDDTNCQQLLADTEVLFMDECHHLGSDTWYTVSVLCPAYYRYGLSGTPLDRTDGADLRLIASTGDVIVDISNKFLVERGISAKADIIFDTVREPVLAKNARYPTAYKQGVSENPNLLKKVVEWTKLFRQEGLGCLILVEEISQGKLLDDMLWTATDGDFIPHAFIHGSETSEIRKQTLKDFAEGALPVLIASTILDEGVDVPTIDALILAGSRKSRIRTMQRLGRGLRGDKLIVVEFANFCQKHLIKHSMQRLDDYKTEECFDIYHSGPDLALIQKLWNEEN